MIPRPGTNSAKIHTTAIISLVTISVTAGVAGASFFRVFKRSLHRIISVLAAGFEAERISNQPTLVFKLNRSLE